MHSITKFLSALLISAATTANAEAMFTSNDGTIRISGEVLAFDGVNITIKSSLGELSIPAGKFRCEGADCPVLDVLGQEIRVSGSDILLRLVLPQTLVNYATTKGNALISRDLGNSETAFEITNASHDLVATINSTTRFPSQAFQDLLNGSADIIMTSRRITDQEIDAFLDAGYGDLSSSQRETIIAQDGLVVITSPDHPVRSLTVNEIEGIFSGRITNWSEVGGINLPISVIAPAEGTGEAEFFFNAVLDPEFSNYTGNAQRVASLSGLAAQVALDEGAIGLTSTGSVGDAKPLAIGSTCGIVSESDQFSIKTEDYPLLRRLYIYTTSRTVPPIASTIVSLVQGVDSDDIVADSGLVNLAISTHDLNSQGKRLAFALSDPSQSGEQNNLRRFAGEVLDAERLSTTFRFGSGSSQLDNKALDDALRMAQLLNSPAYQGREILVIGFTDSIGRTDVNTGLSVRRAQQVVDEIVAASGGTLNANNIQVRGYGASSPLACNDTVASRQLNRHVEVWVR